MARPASCDTLTTMLVMPASSSETGCVTRQVQRVPAVRVTADLDRAPVHFAVARLEHLYGGFLGSEPFRQARGDTRGRGAGAGAARAKLAFSEHPRHVTLAELSDRGRDLADLDQVDTHAGLGRTSCDAGNHVSNTAPSHVTATPRQLLTALPVEGLRAGTTHVCYAPRAWSMSSMMSSMCSRPIDSRTISGVIPTFASAAASSWRWVVEAGWATSDLASPMFTSRFSSRTPSKKRMAASRPPAGPKVNIEGYRPPRYRLASSWWGSSAKPR